ncbi:hypothetical protein CYMTET_17394, partial [Cymbomonas tetramitiformis]
GAKVLACTSTNKAIDSLVSKFEAAGVEEMLTVGSAERMGEASRRYLMSARLSRDTTVNKAEDALAAATNRRECCEEDVDALKKPKKPKKEKGGQENNRGFVERQLGKIKADKKEAKKTPGVVRLKGIIGFTAESCTNAELVAAAQIYLTMPADEDDAATYEARAAAKKLLKEAAKAEEELQVKVDKLKAKAAQRIFRRARIVVLQPQRTCECKRCQRANTEGDLLRGELLGGERH